jgi:8-amino-7-oxononanoate synthase
MSLHERWQRDLDELRRLGRYRRLQTPHGHDFTSNDYLGYGARIDTDAGDLSRSGIASRLLRGHHAIWDEVERQLADWHDCESATMFTSGYIANEGLLSTVIGPDDWVASDEFNHASIIDGLRLTKAERFIYPHNDVARLDTALGQSRVMGRECFVVTESLYGMEGDIAPLAELADVVERHGAHLIVDEAHATGCFGATGSGIVDSLGLRPRLFATMHTGGKALGVPGAYVVGSAMLRELLVNRCRHLIFTTALPSRIGSWWLDAIRRVQVDDAARKRLHENVDVFRRALAKTSLVVPGRDYVVPIVLGDDHRAVLAAERLQRAGFDVRAIRPPTVPPGTARLRVSIHADHEPALLNELANAVAQVVGEIP